MRCLDGVMLSAKTWRKFPAGAPGMWAAEGLDKALPLLWTLADKARSHGTLGLFLQMAEWIRTRLRKEGVHHESDSPP